MTRIVFIVIPWLYLYVSVFIPCLHETLDMLYVSVITGLKKGIRVRVTFVICLKLIIVDIKYTR